MISYEEHLRRKSYYESLEGLKTKFGTPYRIKEYINSSKVIIEFPFSSYTSSTSLKCAIEERVTDPFYRLNRNEIPFIFEGTNNSKSNLFLGREYITNGGEKLKIIEYQNYHNVRVRFMDPPYYETDSDMKDIVRGHIKSPYWRNKFGGYMGEGTEYTGREYRYLHSIWTGILIRGNYQKFKDTSYGQSIKSYENCIVAEEWKNYTNFSRDYMNKLSQLNPNIKYDIDKDLLYPFYKDKTNGMPCYSNETTVLLPAEINNTFIGLNPYRKCIIARNRNGKEYIEYQYYVIDNFINSLEKYWKDKLQYYLSIGALLPEIYNLLENLRIEKIRLIQENNPWYLERKNK